MKSTTALIIAIIAIILVGWLIISNNRNDKPATTNQNTTIQESDETDNTNESTTESNQEPVVTYSANGFSPATLTVKKGTTVTFRNTSGSQMWVASDPHPSHTRLPAFDAEKGIASGDSYSFTFNETGSWGYHNHLDTDDKGTIVVQ